MQPNLANSKSDEDKSQSVMNSSNFDDIYQKGKELFLVLKPKNFGGFYKEYKYQKINEKLLETGKNQGEKNNNEALSERGNNEEIISLLKKKRKAPEKESKLKNERVQTKSLKYLFKVYNYKNLSKEKTNNKSSGKAESEIVIFTEDYDLKKKHKVKELKSIIFDFFTYAFRKIFSYETKSNYWFEKYKKDFALLIQTYDFEKLLEENFSFLSFEPVDKNKWEDEEVCELLKKIPSKYMEEILSNALSIAKKINETNTNNINEDKNLRNKKSRNKKIKIDKENIEKFIKIFKCFRKKEENEKKERIEKGMIEDFDMINENNSNDKKESIDYISPILSNFNQNNIIRNPLDEEEWSTADRTKERKTLQSKKTKKTNRKDNLINVLKNFILKEFTKEFNAKNKSFKLLEKPRKEKGEAINKTVNTNFFETNFEKYLEKCEKNVKEKGEVNEEAKELVSKTKLSYLKELMKDKGEKFFEEDKNMQIKKKQNVKCKIKAYELFKSGNIDGLILLLKFIVVEKNLNVKIPNPQKFENAIKNLSGSEDFNIQLTKEENNEINERAKKLKEIALDPICYLKSIHERPNKRKK